MGTVDSYDSRLDDTDAGENRSRTVSKGYSFIVNSKEYRGFGRGFAVNRTSLRTQKKLLNEEKTMLQTKTHISKLFVQFY
ncbi:MAG: hypothetical protein BWY46_00172 [Firmicutes bacterium ADurb.Bin300]|nr:MAG: hypothetical protein BWY46_00172 [Firmicutes bacterium ADurb.Bin300]HOD01812.1 hypothetical protein [Clostridiales bacterium]